MKTCNKCGETKYLSDFYPHKTTKDRHSGHCKDCHKAAMMTAYAARKLRNPESVRTSMRNNDLKNRYGIDLETYNKMLDQQNHVCAICNEMCDSKAVLSVDHCHSTGKVRGLLCHDCNTSLGGFRDNQALLEAAIAYLRKHGE